MKKAINLDYFHAADPHIDGKIFLQLQWPRRGTGREFTKKGFKPRIWILWKKSFKSRIRILRKKGIWITHLNSSIEKGFVICNSNFLIFFKSKILRVKEGLEKPSSEGRKLNGECKNLLLQNKSVRKDTKSTNSKFFLQEMKKYKFYILDSNNKYKSKIVGFESQRMWALPSLTQMGRMRSQKKKIKKKFYIKNYLKKFSAKYC